MSKLKRVTLEYKDGVAFCQYRYKHYLFEGEAICHEDDKDFESELVGLELADNRAYLKYLKVRRDELAIRYETLTGFYKQLKSDKYFNEKSSYALKIEREIAYVYLELQDCRSAIRNIPRRMDEKIKAREDMYQKLRKKRKALEESEK